MISLKHQEISSAKWSKRKRLRNLKRLRLWLHLVHRESHPSSKQTLIKQLWCVRRIVFSEGPASNLALVDLINGKMIAQIGEDQIAWAIYRHVSQQLRKTAPKRRRRWKSC